MLGTGASLSFTVTGKTTVKLVYRSETENQAFVQFVTDYGQVLFYSPYSANDVVSFPTPPSKLGCKFSKGVFEGTDPEATEEAIWGRIEAEERLITVKPSYTDDTTTYTVTVAYEGADGRAAKTFSGLPVGTNRIFTAPAIDGYVFQCWKDAAGTVLGYDADYFMKITGDMTLTAVYGDEAVEARPVIATVLSTTTEGSIHKISAIATRTVPEGYTLAEQGMLYGINLGDVDAESFVFGTTGVLRFISSDLSANGVFTLHNKVSSDDLVLYYRAYMVLINDATGNEETVYSGIVSGSYGSINS